jgi:hypothetical protein
MRACGYGRKPKCRRGSRRTVGRPTEPGARPPVRACPRRTPSPWLRPYEMPIRTVHGVSPMPARHWQHRRPGLADDTSGSPCRAVRASGKAPKATTNQHCCRLRRASTAHVHPPRALSPLRPDGGQHHRFTAGRERPGSCPVARRRRCQRTPPPGGRCRTDRTGPTAARALGHDGNGRGCGLSMMVPNAKPRSPGRAGLAGWPRAGRSMASTVTFPSRP